MKVLIAEAPNGFTKFHRDANCSGLRHGEVTWGADYVARDLEELPDTVEPCQFPCCFQGYKGAGDLKARVHDRAASPPPKGVRIGQAVRFRELGRAEQTVKIVRRNADRTKGELSAETPIARGLLGSEVGEVVDIALPGKVMRVEILSVS
jgi:hypothetical protein